MTLQLKVPKLVCSGCVDTVTKAIQTVDANATVHANPKTKLVSVETQASNRAIEAAIAAVGYTSV